MKGVFDEAVLTALGEYMATLPKIPVGIVCKPSLKRRLEREQEQSLVNLPRLPGSPQFMAIPIYADERQEEDVLAFFDAQFLRLYLARFAGHKEMLAFLTAAIDRAARFQDGGSSRRIAQNDSAGKGGLSPE